MGTTDSMLVTYHCHGDKDRTLLVECLDYNSNGKHKLIGEAKTYSQSTAGALSGRDFFSPHSTLFSF